MIIVGLFACFFAITTIDAQCTEELATCKSATSTINSKIPSPPDVTNHPNLRLLDLKCGPITLWLWQQTDGNKTGVFEFPWMAQLLYHMKSGQTNPEFYCVGTIISSQYILTAAHCVTQLPSTYRLIGVRVGDHDISKERDCDKDENGEELECAERYQEFGVESVHYHPEYSMTQKHNDIALIRLNSTIDFKPLNVKPICLPYGTTANEIRISHLTTSGWGKVPFGPESQVLLQEKLSLIPHEQCKEIYKPFNKTISHKQLCAANLNYIGLCVGESGGPLQAPGIYNDRSARTIQYGVTSYRLLCNSPYPDVYTNVAYYMDWILDTMTAQCTEGHATCINSSQQPTTTTMKSTMSETSDVQFQIFNESLSPPDVTNHPNLRLLDPECGLIGEPKIFGGNKTRVFQYPWMALIAYDAGRPNPQFRCSGTVISSRYVLTAAHCVTSLPSTLRLIGVRVGDHDISKERDCDKDENGLELDECAEKYQDISIESVHYHPQFTTRKMQNDIALIRLNSSVNFDPLNVQSICLPFGDAANLTQKRVIITGWGATEFGMRSADLLQAKLPIVPHEQCKEVYKQMTEIWHKQLCAGGLNYIDSCLGDTGGPLQAPGIYNGRYIRRSVRMIQYGVISFGIKQCGTEGFPGVYTNVAYYMDWILNTITD